MLDDLPVDVDKLIDVVGGLLLHPHTAHDLFGESEPPDRGAGELTMTRMLQKLVTLDPRPLSHPRPPERRLRVNCSRFAMLFLTILRHRGIPVRKRAGFDWDGWIHEIPEYWDERRNHWVLVDPDPATRAPIRNFLARTGQADHDVADIDAIKSGEAFTPGFLAWRLCRSGQSDANHFHVKDHDGMASARIALIQDLDSMNKSELRTFDAWHEMITAPLSQLDDSALNWLDEAAALIADSDTRFNEMRTFYTSSVYGTTIHNRLLQSVS